MNQLRTAGAFPWMNMGLILANAGALAWAQAKPGLTGRWQLDVHTAELWRFIAYSFIHLGWKHLLFNMVVLYLLGGPVNQRLGQLGYLAFYLGGAVFAGVGFLVSGGDAVVGASGAVGAVMAGYLVLLPRSEIRLGPARISGKFFVAGFFFYNVVMSVATRFGVEEVAYEAHVAGMVFGFLVALGLVAGRLVQRQGEDLLSLGGAKPPARRKL